MAILLRTDKGSKLTYIEADENFSSLFYSASISGNTLSLYYTGSQFAPAINPVNIDIPQGSSYWTASLGGRITRTSDVGITGNLQVIGQVTGSVLRLSSLPQGTTETKILVADGSGNVRFRTDLQLQGPQGVQGSTGAQGIQGVQGTRGIQGIQGLQGVEGDEGVQGIQGIQGPQGTQGIQGLLGLQGIQGIQGPQGTQGTQGIQGNQGIQGLQGIQGPQGTQGIQGPQGTQGIQGIQGLQGIQGTQGTQGIQGTQGTQGIQGLQGRQGTQGLQGTQGTQGIQGFIGQTGLGFLIAKVYSSVAALEADTAPTDIVSGEFAIITTADPNNVDNSRLYLWDGYVYTYINDLSGAAGIQGIQGTQGVQGIQGVQGVQGLQGTTYLQGTGISLVGGTITNTAPDQTVALTQGGATTITGTYPNFTISSTDTNTWDQNTKTVPGYVTAPGAVANKVWKTDGSGNPDWRDDAGGVTQIVAGTNITVSPTGGTGIVTVNSTASTLSLQSTTVGDYYVLLGAPSDPYQTYPYFDASATGFKFNAATHALTVQGSITAAGFFNSSDRRLKSITRRDGDVAYYRWLDGRDSKEHIGYIAQEQQQKHPDQVGTDGEFLTVNYTEILVAKVRQLEKEVQLLKSRL